MCALHLHPPSASHGRATESLHDRNGERGSGLLASGLVATLLLLVLLLASQTLLLLQRSTLADAVAFDAAAALATRPASADAAARAMRRGESILGATASVMVISDGDPVVVAVTLPTPGLLRYGPASVRVIVRTARVRREDFRRSAIPS